jgi:hypothetical protein
MYVRHIGVGAEGVTDTVFSEPSLLGVCGRGDEATPAAAPTPLLTERARINTETWEAPFWAGIAVLAKLVECFSKGGRSGLVGGNAEIRKARGESIIAWANDIPRPTLPPYSNSCTLAFVEYAEDCRLRAVASLGELSLVALGVDTDWRRSDGEVVPVGNGETPREQCKELNKLGAAFS